MVEWSKVLDGSGSKMLLVHCSSKQLNITSLQKMCKQSHRTCTPIQNGNYNAKCCTYYPFHHQKTTHTKDRKYATCKCIIISISYFEIILIVYMYPLIILLPIYCTCSSQRLYVSQPDPYQPTKSVQIFRAHRHIVYTYMVRIISCY